jgi:hypothetical protein
MTGTRKTNYMMAFYNSVQYRAEPPKMFDLWWIARDEILPLIKQHPDLINYVSPEMREAILHWYMPEFVHASLFPPSAGWKLIDQQSFIMEAQAKMRGFV